MQAVEFPLPRLAASRVVRGFYHQDHLLKGSVWELLAVLKAEVVDGELEGFTSKEQHIYSDDIFLCDFNSSVEASNGLRNKSGKLKSNCLASSWQPNITSTHSSDQIDVHLDQHEMAGQSQHLWCLCICTSETLAPWQLRFGEREPKPDSTVSQSINQLHS